MVTNMSKKKAKGKGKDKDFKNIFDFLKISGKWWLPGAEGSGRWENVGQQVQTSSFMSKFWESNVHHGDYS